MTQVYCHNTKCRFNEPCPTHLLRRRLVGTDQQFDSDKYRGMCSEHPDLMYFLPDVGKRRVEVIACCGDVVSGELECNHIGCSWNHDNTCDRDEIGIDLKSGFWTCTNDSTYPSWRIDMSKLPLGGGVDDSYGDRIAADQKRTKSYSTHMKFAKERKK